MQTRNVVGLASPFSQVCNDGSFYILEISSLTWIKLTNVPDIQPRTYHTATSCILAGNLCVAFIGGIIVSNNCPSERICVDECILLKAVDISNNHFSLDKFKFEMTKPIYISYHSSIVIKTSLYIVGGFVQAEKHIAGKPLLNNNIIKFDTESKSSELIEIDSSFATAGNSSIALADDCLMVVGGVAENFFVYTTKALRPTACDLADKCKITDSPEISPIAWVQCESTCHRWLHQFCVGLLDKGVPRGKYVCPDCRPTVSRKRKR